jgi:acetyltransferase-like isoleucine patch superfamily enzyme
MLEPAAVVLAQASVGPLSVVGVGGLLNTGASLDHESTIGKFASLGPGAHTGGKVIIGARAMVGLNAGVLQGISVGADTVIGAQSLVRQDIPEGVVAYGVPCKPVRARSTSDIYYQCRDMDTPNSPRRRKMC